MADGNWFPRACRSVSAAGQPEGRGSAGGFRQFFGVVFVAAWAKDHTTTPLTAEDINDDTLLLVMEDSQREKIREDFPDAPHLQTIAGFLRLAGDIPALYGEPLTEYGKCYEALEFLIEGVLARLKEEEEQ